MSAMILWMGIVAVLVGCQPEAAGPDSEVVDPAAATGAERNVEGGGGVVAGAQPAAGDDAESRSELEIPVPGAQKSSATGGSPAASEDRNVAVDAGNPVDVGPGGGSGSTGKLKLRLADAVPADGAQSVILRIHAVELVGQDATPNAWIPVPAQDLNLLDFREGRSFPLIDGSVPEGHYARIRLLLAPDDPATLVAASGVSSRVFVPPVTPGAPPALEGAIDLVVTTIEADVTMHVDLRYGLRSRSDGLDPALAVLDDAPYWLVPEHSTFLSASVGAVRGLGMEPLLGRVVCAYPVGTVSAPTEWPAVGGLIPLLPSVHVGASSCRSASGSAVAGPDGFYVGYLPPGSYVLHLYLSDTSYVTLPNLVPVVAGTVSVVDLSGLAEALDLLFP